MSYNRAPRNQMALQDQSEIIRKPKEESMKNIALIPLKQAVWIGLLAALLSTITAIDVVAQESKSNDNSPASLGDVPAWLHSYPGAKPTITYSSKSESSVYVSFTFGTEDAVNNVADYYERQLQSAGLNPEKSIKQGFQGTEIQFETSSLKEPTISINIGPGNNNQTEVRVTYFHYKTSLTPFGRSADNKGVNRLFYGIFSLYGVIILVTLVIGVVTTAFWIWMLIDCLSKESGHGNDKLIWALVIIFAHFLGAILYFAIRRPKRKAELGR
jgi:hypothetical protein